MMKRVAGVLSVSLVGGVLLFPTVAAAQNDQGTPCGGLPGHTALQTALDAAIAAPGNGGLGNNMWATIVNRDGFVCAVAFTGVDRGAEWPGSRAISAQKANTGNAFSYDGSGVSGVAGQLFPHGLALSTANLYAAVQPGGSLFGLQHSNPVDPAVAYGGDPTVYGTASDPMVGHRIGGVNVFGGGLALYAPGKVIVGGVGVSGDTSCTDHFVAWHVRNNLGLDHLGVPADPLRVKGVSGDSARPDNIVFDFAPNLNGNLVSNSGGGFGHPTCLGSGTPSSLPPVTP